MTSQSLANRGPADVAPPATGSRPSAWAIIVMLLASVALAEGLGITPEILDMVTSKYGRNARTRVIAWDSLVNRNLDQPIERKLALVNEFFNRGRFVSDREHWQREDYWATPFEFLGTHAGDCEDFTIAKYVTLKALAVPDEQLRITYVKSVSLDQAHMVLAWYAHPGAMPLVLDNLVDAIKPASERADLIPVYSFNGSGLWRNKMRGESGSADDLGPWRDLMTRMQLERPAS